MGECMKDTTIELKIKVRLSLWSAIKIRIAGINQLIKPKTPALPPSQSPIHPAHRRRRRHDSMDFWGITHRDDESIIKMTHRTISRQKLYFNTVEAGWIERDIYAVVEIDTPSFAEHEKIIKQRNEYSIWKTFEKIVAEGTVTITAEDLVGSGLSPEHEGKTYKILAIAPMPIEFKEDKKYGDLCKGCNSKGKPFEDEPCCRCVIRASEHKPGV